VKKERNVEEADGKKQKKTNKQKETAENKGEAEDDEEVNKQEEAPQGVTTQKNNIDIFTAVRPSNLPQRHTSRSSCRRNSGSPCAAAVARSVLVAITNDPFDPSVCDTR
jgi:hypothetical protein